MKRNLALIMLFVAFMAALTLVPVLAQRDDKPTEDSGKFIRMGENAIPGQYIVVLDVDVDGGKGDLGACRNGGR